MSTLRFNGPLEKIESIETADILNFTLESSPEQRQEAIRILGGGRHLKRIIVRTPLQST